MYLLEEIAEGVWQLKVPMARNPLRYTYSYLIKNEGTIIDTGVGTPQAYEAFKRQLRRLDFEVRKIRRIILTHLHGDHIGLVDSIKDVSGALIYVHEKGAERLQEWGAFDREHPAQSQTSIKLLGGLSYQDAFMFRGGGLGHPPRGFEPPFRPDYSLCDGDVIDLDDLLLRVIWTPGHAPEHICIYDKERRTLFSGDHVLPMITSHVNLNPFEESNPLKDFLDSLDKLRSLSVDIVLPAHEHAFKGLEARIEELKRHHDNRCEEVLSAIGAGEKNTFQIASKISWDSVPWRFMTFWTKRMAASETYAHLVYLKNEGKVEETLGDGVLYYYKTD